MAFVGWSRFRCVLLKWVFWGLGRLGKGYSWWLSVGSAQEVGPQEEDQVSGRSFIGEEGAGFVLAKEGGDGEVIEEWG